MTFIHPTKDFQSTGKVLVVVRTFTFRLSYGVLTACLGSGLASRLDRQCPSTSSRSHDRNAENVE